MPAQPNAVRSLVAIIGGVVLLNLLDRMLEGTLVGAMAETPPTDLASFVAVRNRTGVLAASLVGHTLVSILAGYITGKIAAAYEERHAGVVATVLTAGYAWAFFGMDNPALPPLWAQVAMLVVTGPAMLLGATVRGQARRASAVGADLQVGPGEQS